MLIQLSASCPSCRLRDFRNLVKLLLHQVSKLVADLQACPGSRHCSDRSGAFKKLRKESGTHCQEGYSSKHEEPGEHGKRNLLVRQHPLQAI